MKNAISLMLALALFLPCVAGAQGKSQSFPTAAIRQLREVSPWVSPFELPLEDEGFAGARLGIRDNDTTGRFLEQNFTLREASVPLGDDPVTAFEELLADGNRYFVLDLPAKSLLRIADATRGRDVVLFNAEAYDDSLRGAD